MRIFYQIFLIVSLIVTRASAMAFDTDEAPCSKEQFAVDFDFSEEAISGSDDISDDTTGVQPNQPETNRRATFLRANAVRSGLRAIVPNEPLGGRKRSQSLDSDNQGKTVVQGSNSSDCVALPAGHSALEHLYIKRFYSHVGMFEKFNDAEREVAYLHMLDRIKQLQSRDKIYEFFRETQNMEHILSYFRWLVKSQLAEHLEAFHKADLSFIKKAPKIPPQNPDPYVTFLSRYLLPMARDLPGEVAEFFYHAAEAVEPVLSEDALEGFDHFDFAMCNLILSVLLPVIHDYRSSKISFSSAELLHFEQKEMQLLGIETLPAPGTIEEKEFVEGVFQKMNSQKLQRVEATFAPQRKQNKKKIGILFSKFTEEKMSRRAQEANLLKLLQKSFKQPSTSSTDNCPEFFGGYALLIDDPNSTLADFKLMLKSTVFSSRRGGRSKVACKVLPINPQ